MRRIYLIHFRDTLESLIELRHGESQLNYLLKKTFAFSIDSEEEVTDFISHFNQVITGVPFAIQMISSKQLNDMATFIKKSHSEIVISDMINLPELSDVSIEMIPDLVNQISELSLNVEKYENEIGSKTAS